ncbi:magnesium and cobalt transport protein CorA [Paenibacillus nasutitermitis]|uniref:Magnesium and cobalt transport protein CorA n=1 Tax=Paenibacillus nasutitermitis TaxID=1652958 RepID=A0A917DNI5_9BACL|nr:magnesium and cobalt transport protein CorA [Paenibacillus nasutitermitis]GGD51798.1 hypothetical protein GCM10010911_06690 [Paenibacillus nasutitermitis]
MKERCPKERLFWLLSQYKNGEIEIDSFCNEFHITYAHDLEFDEITQKEEELFERLSRCAARFSNDIEDQVKYPNVYTTTEEIQEIANKIFQELNI